MEPQQQMQQQANEDGSSSSNSKSNFLCRQSSTRWTPTTDQIRILKDLYYNNGIRSPTAEQIQRISARLRQYGKIEGKNVFYWFQNHKARERQKKRFTVDMAMQKGAVGVGGGGGGVWKPEDSIHNKYTSINPGICSSSSPSPGVLGMGQMGSTGYGAFLMEKSFGDFSISGGGCDGIAGSTSNNFGWAGMDPYSSMYTLYDQRNSINGAYTEDDEQDGGGGGAPANGMETLPLFPMHGEDASPSFADWHYSTGRYGAYNDKGNSGSRTSLELTLNSYGSSMSPESS